MTAPGYCKLPFFHYRPFWKLVLRRSRSLGGLSILFLQRPIFSLGVVVVPFGMFLLLLRAESVSISQLEMVNST
jgi:hypothetical protein